MQLRDVSTVSFDCLRVKFMVSQKAQYPSSYRSFICFRTLPVIRLRVWIDVDPSTLDPEFLNCRIGGREITCLDVEVCFDYTDEHGLPDDVSKFKQYLNQCLNKLH